MEEYAEHVEGDDALTRGVEHAPGGEDRRRPDVLPLDRRVLPPGVNESIGPDGRGVAQGTRAPVMICVPQDMPVMRDAVLGFVGFKLRFVRITARKIQEPNS